MDRIIPTRASQDEGAKIGPLGEAIYGVEDYNNIPVLLAEALADGLSLEGAGEALSIGAAGLFLRSLTGNPMDVHLHTSVNLRRWLLRLDGLSRWNKLMILLTWHTGPEVKSTQYRMESQPQMDEAAVARLPRRTQDELLDAIAVGQVTRGDLTVRLERRRVHSEVCDVEFLCHARGLPTGADQIAPTRSCASHGSSMPSRPPCTPRTAREFQSARDRAKDMLEKVVMGPPGPDVSKAQLRKYSSRFARVPALMQRPCRMPRASTRWRWRRRTAANRSFR